MRGTRRALAAVVPVNNLGENGGAAIGKALEKNATLLKLNLACAPLTWLLFHSCTSLGVGVCFSVLTRVSRWARVDRWFVRACVCVHACASHAGVCVCSAFRVCASMLSLSSDLVVLVCVC